MIRNAKAADAAAIATVYNYYVLETVVTFEEVAVSAEEMWMRVEGVQFAGYPWLVYEEDGVVTGYAYANAWKARAAYRHSVEISVYLAPGVTGRGLGRQLYVSLIDSLRQMQVHAVIGGVALPNNASARLHEGLGFSKVAHFRETGWKLGQWVDVAYWELILEN